MSSSFVGQDVAHCGHCLPRQMARAPLTAHAAELYATGAPVVLAGDYNVVPTDLDIYSTKSWDRDALLQPESRAAYQRLLSPGWTDAVRSLHPEEPMYTFWDYKAEPLGTRRRSASRSHSAELPFDGPPARRWRRSSNTRLGRRPSDHAPVWVELRDAPDRRRAPLRHASGEATVAAATALPKTVHRPIGPAMGRRGEAVQRELASPRSRVARS